MQSKFKKINVSACMLATCIVAILTLTAAIPTAEVSADEVEYDQDLGQFYSFTVQFVFSGSQAETISWDFGDGSEASTEWNPRHEFAAIGTYYVTQTLTNSYNGGSTTVSTYKVQIMGFPSISFESNGGSAIESIQQTAYNVTATEPTQPTKDGYVFGGWYKDAELTSAMDWSAGVTRSMTLYASWTEESEIVYNTVTFDGNGVPGIPQIEVEHGQSMTVPDCDLVNYGYRFAGWLYDGVTYNPGDTLVINSDITMTVIWEIYEPEQFYTVTFDVAGIAVDIPNAQAVASGETVIEADCVVELEGYDLVWLLDGEVYDFSSAVTSDITLTLSATQHPVQDEDDRDSHEFAKIALILLAVILGIILLAVVLAHVIA